MSTEKHYSIAYIQIDGIMKRKRMRKIHHIRIADFPSNHFFNADQVQTLAKKAWAVAEKQLKCFSPTAKLVLAPATSIGEGEQEIEIVKLAHTEHLATIKRNL